MELDTPLDPQGAETVTPPVVAPPEPPALDAAEERELADKAAPNDRGERMVPLAALREERQSTRQTKEQLKQAQQQLAAMQPIVENYKQIEPLLPYLAVMAQNLGQPPAAPAAPAAPATPAADPKLMAIAERLGTDPETASRLIGVVREIAAEESSSAVRPIAQLASTTAASRQRERLYNVKDPQGRPFAPREAIDQVFTALERTNPELVANEQVANLLALVARGMAPAPSGPTLSETPGGGRAPSMVSDFGRRAAEARGISMDKFNQLRNLDSAVLE